MSSPVCPSSDLPTDLLEEFLSDEPLPIELFPDFQWEDDEQSDQPPTHVPGTFTADNAFKRKHARIPPQQRTKNSRSQAQTPQQRAANARFAKQQESKMGKPAVTIVKQQKQKSPISMGWVVALGIVLCGGALLEIIRLFF
jgi:hypothetical protein